MNNRSLKRFSISAFFQEYMLYFLLLAIMAVFALNSKSFLSVNNAIQVLSDASALLICSVGLTFVILSGNLDLSVGSCMMLTAAIVCVFSRSWTGGGLAGVVLMTAMSVVIGAAVGAFNGLLISRLNLSPFLVTLGMQIVLKGLAFTITKSTNVALPQAVKAVAAYRIGGRFPWYILLGLFTVLLGQWLLKQTTYGRKVAAVGCNGAAATKIGIYESRMKFSVYVLSGLFAGLAGFIAASNLGAVTPTTGQGMEFLSTACIVLGGTSLFGGKGALLPNTLIGVIFMSVLENGLVLIGANVYVIPLARGLIIFLAMYLDSMKNKK